MYGTLLLARPSFPPTFLLRDTFWGSENGVPAKRENNDTAFMVKATCFAMNKALQSCTSVYQCVFNYKVVVQKMLHWSCLIIHTAILGRWFLSSRLWGQDVKHKLNKMYTLSNHLCLNNDFNYVKRQITIFSYLVEHRKFHHSANLQESRKIYARFIYLIIFFITLIQLVFSPWDVKRFLHFNNQTS